MQHHHHKPLHTQQNWDFKSLMTCILLYALLMENRGAVSLIRDPNDPAGQSRTSISSGLAQLMTPLAKVVDIRMYLKLEQKVPQ